MVPAAASIVSQPAGASPAFKRFKMNKTFLILGAIVVALLLFVGYFFSVKNTITAKRFQIEAAYKNDQNILSEVTNTMKTKGMVNKEYQQAVITSIEKALSGRYGSGGAKQAILLLKEDNPKMDATTFNELSRYVEIGYAKFSASQTSRLDMLRAYDTYRMSYPQAMFCSGASDLKEFRTLVVSDDTHKAFDTGTQNAVNPF